MFALWLFLACWASFLRLGSVLVSRAFSEGFDHVLGALGFLLPPYTFCGLPILLCGKTKVWVGNAGDVRFSERFCC